MPKDITKTGIEFDTITYQRVKQPDGSFLYFEMVTYEVQTTEEGFPRTTQRQLGGAVRTAVEARFNNVDSVLRNKEGL